MKNAILILTAIVLMNCGDNRKSSEGKDIGGDDKTETLEPDTATNGGIYSDTTSMFDRDRDAEVNKEAGEKGESNRNQKEHGDVKHDSIK